MNSNTFWLLLAIILLACYAGRETYRLIRYSRQQRIDIQAQRIMLSFCKNPTRANWNRAWDFITENEVMLSELDWPLVERFTRTVVSVNFSPEVKS